MSPVHRCPARLFWSGIRGNSHLGTCPACLWTGSSRVLTYFPTSTTLTTDLLNARVICMRGALSSGRVSRRPTTACFLDVAHRPSASSRARGSRCPGFLTPLGCLGRKIGRRSSMAGVCSGRATSRMPSFSSMPMVLIWRWRFRVIQPPACPVSNWSTSGSVCTHCLTPAGCFIRGRTAARTPSLLTHQTALVRSFSPDQPCPTCLGPTLNWALLTQLLDQRYCLNPRHPHPPTSQEGSISLCRPAKPALQPRAAVLQRACPE